MSHLHFTQSLDAIRGGGLATSAIAIHQSMLSQEIDSDLVSTYNKSDAKPILKSVRNSYLFQEPIKSGFFLSPSMFCSYRLRNKKKYYHSHGLHTFLQFYFSSSYIGPSAKLIIHPHGFFEPYIKNRSKFIKSIVGKLFEDKNFRECSLWRALTVTEANQILDIVPNANIEVIPNGVEKSHKINKQKARSLVASSYKIDLSEKKVILYLGRLHPKKGLDLLVCSLNRLLLEKNDWHCIVAGSGDENYKKNLSDLVRSLGLSHHITFVGTVTGSQKQILFSASSLFILTSFSEGLPMSLLEASSYGLPFLYTPQCNLHGFSGLAGAFLVETQIDSIVRGLRDALSYKINDLEELGDDLRTFVGSEFEWGAISRKLDNACKSL